MKKILLFVEAEWDKIKLEKPEVISIKEKDLKIKNFYEILDKYALKEKNYLRRLYEITLSGIKSFPILGSTYHVFMERFKEYNKIIIFTLNDKLPDYINNFIDKIK